MKKICLILVVFSSFIGCAMGNKYDYQSSNIALPVKPITNTTLILSVEDLRPYVLDGQKAPNFVGVQRGGYGNPFDVTTLSGKSMTEDMTMAITAGLTKVGYRVKNVQGKPDNVYLIKIAAETGASRIVVLKVYEWKSDIYMGIGLHCDILLNVFDANLKLLAESNMKFAEGIGGVQIGAARNSQIITDEFAKRIGYLFNKAEIRKSLE